MEGPLSSPFVDWPAGQQTLPRLALFLLIVLGLIGVLLFLAGWLGNRQPTAVKAAPYESGIIPSGSARFSYPAPFYLVAIFFLVFDVEAAFIFSWAIAFDQLGWMGWLRITFFIIILLISFIYLWAKGGLEWGPAKHQP